MKKSLPLFLFQINCLCFLIFFLFPTYAVGDNLLSSKYNKSVLSEILPAPMVFAPLPPANDEFWRSDIPIDMRKDYIRYGEDYYACKWEPIDNSIFAEYKRNGNRTNYERKSFSLRRQLASLVLAEILDHQGRFINDITKGLHYFIHEIWWGVPAHYPTAQPDSNEQIVDLFNAETANLLAWSIYMLHDEIENTEKGLCETIRTEIERRMLIPALTTNYAWKKKTNNWNTWICSNWLSCVLFCEKEKDKQIEAISQILQCLDLFYDAYPQDGGCEEGIGYWDRAAASLFESLFLFELATGENVPLKDQQKFKNMGAFVYKTYIGNDKFVTFSDATPKSNIQPNIALPFAHYIKDPLLEGYAIKTASTNSFKQTPSKLFSKSGNYPTLSREILFLFQYSKYSDILPTEPLPQNVWMPTSQVFAARQSEGSVLGLYIAAKGGNNNESHNHNDVGNFVVYNDAEPIIIDIGTGTYTAQSFSKQRYELFNCRSAYHNVPLINGCEQHEGKDYMATDVKYTSNEKLSSLTLDISEAYPKEAYVSKWKRTIQLNRGKEVLVTEQFKLKKYKRPSEIILICCGKAQLEGSNKIVINNGKNKGALYFNADQLSPSIEKIVFQDNTILNAWQKRSLYRIRLSLRNESLKGTISYSIKQE